MRVSTTVRSVALLVGLAVLGACGDSPMAPSASATRSIRADEVEVPALSRWRGGNVPIWLVDSNTVAFTIDPNRDQTVAAGGNSLVFPAHSICDPAVSGYGPDLWDAPCSPLTKPITITADYSYRDGHAEVDFHPALRFAPGTDRRHWVVLTLQERIRLNPLFKYVIKWQAPDGSWVDESLTDPTMLAWTDPTGNKVSRRIKHFSGYNVTAGCVETGVAEVSW
jgi:hypothetical protein